MTTVANCMTDSEAMLVKSLLEANGIEVFAPEQFTPEAGLHFAGQALRIQVEDEDAELARQVLADAETHAHTSPDRPIH